ncbi:2-phosphosulfolactate phosphatase [Echinicola vietnamensis]|uniref:Probable 2-phosphosulfolactate phosphatase n=1 Tax=Echinicola vietnamensis (strain DSM 17526 / LMG 23754 / KMM 6221) TaxID=926556 RepID=L0FR11_ECHVK|nr:2-phosphosulfolactate phosphatase [Echinicola vietnamensis]AGA76389.1 phosphosulfolactate phosphohydrolase-like enzyme [Echinicola vietnamensis DSM 17526]
MNKIEVCLSPELIHLHDLHGKIVVVVDIFRATSTMVTGLANKVTSITPVAGLEACRTMKSKGYIIAGERNGQTAEGFELGNSPLSYLNNGFEGKKIAVTTTNGTLTIEKSKATADEVLIGAFLNLQATATYLAQQNKDVVIHCAGWKGMFNLEDSLYAGALVSVLDGQFEYDCDGAIAMKALFEQHKDDLKGFLSQASHAKRLQNHNIEADIDFCLTMDEFNFIGKLQGEELVKVAL